MFWTVNGRLISWLLVNCQSLLGPIRLRFLSHKGWIRKMKCLNNNESVVYFWFSYTLYSNMNECVVNTSNQVFNCCCVCVHYSWDSECGTCLFDSEFMCAVRMCTENRTLTEDRRADNRLHFIRIKYKSFTLPNQTETNLSVFGVHFSKLYF